MGIIRLPVSGDWVEAGLVAGVSAAESPDGGGVVTVWVADGGGRPGTLDVFCVMDVADLESAEAVRDMVATQAGLDRHADTSGYDAARAGDDGEDDEDEGGGGPPAPRPGAAPDGGGGGGVAADKAVRRAKACWALAVLEIWTPDRARPN